MDPWCESYSRSKGPYGGPQRRIRHCVVVIVGGAVVVVGGGVGVGVLLLLLPLLGC